VSRLDTPPTIAGLRAMSDMLARRGIDPRTISERDTARAMLGELLDSAVGQGPDDAGDGPFKETTRAFEFTR